MDENIKEMETKEALDQSIALGKLTTDILEKTNRNLKFVYILLAISIIINAIIVGAFLWYESHMEFTETTTTTQTVDGESSINNTRVEGDQYQDDSTHNDSRKTEKK